MDDLKKFFGAVATGFIVDSFFGRENESTRTKNKEPSPPLESIVKSQTNDNQSERNPSNVVTTSFGHQLGDIVDMDFFPMEKFSEWQLATIRYADATNKGVHNGISRRMGGPYDEHIKDAVILYLGIAKSLKLDPDYKVLVALILHDSFENHLAIRSKIAEIKDIYEKIQDSKANGEKLQNRVDSIKADISRERLSIIGQMYRDFQKFASNYCKTHDLDDKHKKRMIREGTEVLGVVEWLTRHTEQRFFHASIYGLYTRNTVEDYQSSDIGGALQFKVMQEHGIAKGMEPNEYFFFRVLAKPIDRIVLTKERKQRFTHEQATELEALMEGHDWMQRVYGKTDFRGYEMPRPYSLNLLFRNFVVKNNMHGAFVDYGPEVARGMDQNTQAFSYLRIADEARKILIAKSRNLYEEAKQSYEADIPSEIVEEVKAKVASLPAIYFRTLTGDGAMSRGIGLDANPPKKWEDLDMDHEGKKSIIAMARNYEDILVFGRLLDYFSDKRKNKVDLKHGNFKLFYIEGLTDKPFMDVKPYQSH